MTPEAQPPQGSAARRALRAAARPVTDPMHRRFDALEARLDRLEQLVGEVRDRVETDLATLVELTVELERAARRLDAEAERGEPA